MLKPKILVLYDKNGCCFWRSWLPGQFMQKMGLAEVKFLELRVSTKDELAKAAQWADIIQVLGLMDTNGLAMIRSYRKLGCRLAVDYDDLHFNASPFNPNYKHFGLEPVRVRNPKTGDEDDLWIDGQNGFDIKRNTIKFHAYKQILQESDLITTTTLYLKDALEEISDGKANIRVLPNALDLSQWKPLNVREKFKDKFRFGWAVSASHGEDWLYIKDALVRFLKTHPDAKFVCIGDTYMDIKIGMKEVADQLEWYPFSDLWEGHYQLRMALLGLDAAIMPLADLEFNKCKSPLKFAEMTAFGYPCVAQNMEPYSSHIRHNETGLLAGSLDEWVNCLDRLYNDVNLRSRLRFNALLDVKEMFDLEKVCREWAAVYSDLISGDRIIK